MGDPLRELVEQWRNETEEGEYRHHYADELEEELDRLEERNVSKDLSMSPEHYAALTGVPTLSDEKRTEAKVHGFDHRFPNKS